MPHVSVYSNNPAQLGKLSRSGRWSLYTRGFQWKERLNEKRVYIILQKQSRNLYNAQKKRERKTKKLCWEFLLQPTCFDWQMLEMSCLKLYRAHDGLAEAVIDPRTLQGRSQIEQLWQCDRSCVVYFKDGCSLRLYSTAWPADYYPSV